ncbi:hypothetical protein N4308_14790, partial [Staphylococcus aureus]|nr:hypothetical protein [Staphylococcus aureus]
HTIHNPLVTEPEAIHDGVTPAESATKAQASPQVPATDVDKAITPTAVETASNNNEKPIVQVETFSASISSVDREPVPVTSIPETKV